MKNELLRHILATISYRLQKAVRNSDQDFGEFSIGDRVRTPGEIIRHMYEVLNTTRFVLIADGSRDNWQKKLDFSSETDRLMGEIHHLNSILATREIEPEFSRKLIQGPFSDILTHIGQLSMLSGIYGCPVAGEDYSIAPIAARDVSPQN